MLCSIPPFLFSLEISMQIAEWIFIKIEVKLTTLTKTDIDISLNIAMVKD